MKLITKILNRRKNKLNAELEKLLKTERYKKSEYKIRKFNNRYVLLHKPTNRYVDLRSLAIRTWEQNSTYFRDCIGSLKEVIDVFNFVEPVMKTL